MKILFHITGYKCPEQFAWLYRAIYNQHDLFIIHVDKKSPKQVHAAFREITAEHANTHFLPSQSVIWGGTGLILAELSALEFGLWIDSEWRYLVNLSAQDYINASMDQIRHNLTENWPANFVMCIPLRETHWRIRKRTWFRHIEVGNQRHFTPIPRFPKGGVEIAWHGPWWHVLTREFCEWWVTSPKGEQYYHALENAGMPDELLVQNLINDSPYRSTLRSECKHEIVWRHPGESVSVTSHPNVLTTEDLPTLESSKAFFARKFDSSIDCDVLKILAQRFNAFTPMSYPAAGSGSTN